MAINYPKYHYNLLNSNDKKLYEIIIDGTINFKNSVNIPAGLHMDRNNISKLYDSIAADNPNIFYLNYSKCTFGDSMFNKVFNFAYLYNKNDVAAYIQKIESVAQGIIQSEINAHQSDYDKVVRLHDYLKNNVQYDDAALQALINGKSQGFEMSHNVIGALLNNKCVCEGFAKAMYMLCTMAGVEAIVVAGTGVSSQFRGPHSWNIVKINGYYHHIDVTWDNQFSGNNMLPCYGYLNLSDNTISIDHSWDIALYPPCPEEPYNYFKINDALISVKPQLEKYLYENVMNEEEVITFKVVAGSLLAKEIDSCWQSCVESAVNKCKYVNASEYALHYIPEQLVYSIKITYC